jgi:uncharacterized protein (TIGR00251 family)
LNAKNESKGIQLAVKVTPNAGRDEIASFIDGVLRLKIAAPPDKGKANKELTDFLSRTLGVSKSSVAIIRGQTSRNKVITIARISQEEAIKRITG